MGLSSNEHHFVTSDLLIEEELRDGHAHLVDPVLELKELTIKVNERLLLFSVHSSQISVIHLKICIRQSDPV